MRALSFSGQIQGRLQYNTTTPSAICEEEVEEEESSDDNTHYVCLHPQDDAMIGIDFWLEKVPGIVCPTRLLIMWDQISNIMGIGDASTFVSEIVDCIGDHVLYA